MKPAGKALFVLVMALAAGAHAAQPSFPTRPIRLVLGAFPGGGNDAAARIMAVKFSENIGSR